MKGKKFTLSIVRACEGLTQEQLAKKIGVSTITVSRWERVNLDTMRIKDLRKVCKVLGITPNDIVRLDEE